MRTCETSEIGDLQHKARKHNWRRIAVGCAIVAMISVSSFVVLFYLDQQYKEGMISVVKYIANNEDVVLTLSSKEVMANLTAIFPQKMNYTDLLYWESARLNYTESRIFHSNPIDILNYGKGACGEFTILYTAICLANDIPARYVTTGYLIPNVVDHSWSEVNPSKDSGTWIHVEVTDACYSIQTNHALNPSTVNNTAYYKNHHYTMVLAYQLDANGNVAIIDRTAVYS